MDDKTWLSNLAENKVAGYFLYHRYDVFTPFGGKTKSDIVVIKDDIIYRVQVKGTETTKSDKAGWTVQLRSIRSNRTKNVIHKFDASKSDLIGIYIEPEDRIVILPSKDFHGKNIVTIPKQQGRSSQLAMAPALKADERKP